MRLDRRLQALTRQLGLECPRHGGTLLRCPRCDAGEPLPEVLAAPLQQLVDTIVARVGREAVKAAWLRVPLPPQHAPCHCGSARQCPSCQTSFGRRLLLHEIALTNDEQRQLNHILATCQRYDRTRPGIGTKPAQKTQVLPSRLPRSGMGVSPQHPGSSSLPTKKESRCTSQSTQVPLDPQRPAKKIGPGDTYRHALSRPRRVACRPATERIARSILPFSSCGV
jgi:hypothetical protein